MVGFWNPGLAWALWRWDKLSSTGNRTTVRFPVDGRSPSLIRSRDTDLAASNFVCTECKVYGLTPWSGVLIEKLTVPQLVEKCLALYAIPMFSTVFTKSSRFSLI